MTIWFIFVYTKGLKAEEEQELFLLTDIADLDLIFGIWEGLGSSEILNRQANCFRS